ncbi:MAG: DNA-directed RNA polymerase subunit beta [Paenibacillaceae bacterium]
MTKQPNLPEELEGAQVVEAPKAPNAPKKPRKRKKRWVRIILFTLRLLLVPFLCLCALYAGLVIGYVRLGGQPYSDILEPATWKHLYELVYSSS